MLDCEALEQAIAESGMTKRFIAGKLDFTVQALADKLRGRTEFRASEIQKMKELLKMTNAERDRIFFA